MAKLKVNPAVLGPVEPVLPPVATPATYTLDLTAEEMAALYVVLQLVGGCPASSIRGYCSSISDAMRFPEIYDAVWRNYRGLTPDDLPGIRPLCNEGSAINFKSNTKHNKRFYKIVEILKRKR